MKKKTKRSSAPRRMSGKGLFDTHKNLKILLIIFAISMGFLLLFAKITSEAIEEVQTTQVYYPKPQVRMTPPMHPSPTSVPSMMKRY